MSLWSSVTTRPIMAHHAIAMELRWKQREDAALWEIVHWTQKNNESHETRPLALCMHLHLRHISRCFPTHVTSHCCGVLTPSGPMIPAATILSCRKDLTSRNANKAIFANVSVSNANWDICRLCGADKYGSSWNFTNLHAPYHAGVRPWRCIVGACCLMRVSALLVHKSDLQSICGHIYHTFIVTNWEVWRTLCYVEHSDFSAVHEKSLQFIAQKYICSSENSFFLTFIVQMYGQNFPLIQKF